MTFLGRFLFPLQREGDGGRRVSMNFIFHDKAFWALELLLAQAPLPFVDSSGTDSFSSVFSSPTVC